MVLGQGYPNGEAPAIGRVAALDAGLGTGVPGAQVDRRCGSGLQAVLYAAGQVATGAARVVVAGGVESMSQVEHYALGLRTGLRAGGTQLLDRLDRARETAGGADHPVPGGMLETAENLRAAYGISREEQDAYAVRSQQRAGAAQESGAFADELVPVTVAGRGGDTVVDRDEHPRPGTTLDELAALRPVRLRLDPDATVTAGNASGQNDGAALCVVTTRAEAGRRGLEPMLVLRSWAVAGVGPEVMGIGPVAATGAALDRAGLTLADLDLIELNEAFAVQVLAVLREWGLDPADERLNPHGSGISLGHPVGATGARILATLAHEARRREAPLRPRDDVHRRRAGTRGGVRGGPVSDHRADDPDRQAARLAARAAVAGRAAAGRRALVERVRAGAGRPGLRRDRLLGDRRVLARDAGHRRPAGRAGSAAAPHRSRSPRSCRSGRAPAAPCGCRRAAGARSCSTWPRPGSTCPARSPRSTTGSASSPPRPAPRSTRPSRLPSTRPGRPRRSSAGERGRPLVTPG